MTYSEKTLDLLLKGQIQAAEKEFFWALRKDEPEMLFSLAEELYSLGFSNMAKRVYTKLLEQFPTEDELKTVLAEIAISEGKDDEALNYLKQVTPTSNAYLEALLVLADLYQTQGLFEISEQKLLQAYRLAPDEAVIWFALGELYFSLKQYRQASEFYLKLIKADILEYAKVNILQRLGVSYAASGEFEQARQYLEQIPLPQLDADTLFQLAFTQLQLKDYEHAIQNFEELKEMTADYATLYPYLGVAYEQNGQLNDALVTFQEGISVDSYNVELYQMAGRVAAKLGQNEQAQKYWHKGLELEPENLTLLLELSNLLDALKLDEENLALLEEYLSQEQSDPQLYWNRGKALVRLDRYDEAIEDYQAVLKQLDESVDFLHDATLFFRNVGLREEALYCVQKYLQQVNDDFEMEQLFTELNSELY
jgi:tetratricopeptide (TPR) repeat protein